MDRERQAAEAERRRLMRATDDLLERIEQLRLQDLVRLPDELRGAVAMVAAEIDQPIAARTPRTLADAHAHVFRLQRHLMRGGGDRVRRPGPRPSTPQAAADLFIPEQRRSDGEDAWVEDVRLVVQRAHDRSLYLYAQAQAARHVPSPEGEVLAARRGVQATEAHRTFERLSRDAERLIGRSVTLDSVPTMPNSGQLRLADLVIDLDAGEVHRAGRVVQLTDRERMCLTVLAANPSRVITREALQHVVTGAGPTLELGSRTLDVHVSTLRAKLGHPPYLETVRGVGHRMTGSPAPSADMEAVREQRRAQRRAWARSSTTTPTPTVTPQPTVDRRLGR